MRVFSVWVLKLHFLRRHMCFFPLLASLIVRRMNNTNMIRSNNMKMKCAWGFDVKNGDVDVFIHNSCIWSTFEWILRHEVSVDFTVRKQKKSAKLMKSAKRQSKKKQNTRYVEETLTLYRWKKWPIDQASIHIMQFHLIYSISVILHADAPHRKWVKMETVRNN